MMYIYVAIYVACVYVYVLQGSMFILVINTLLISLSCRPIAPSHIHKLTERNVLTILGLVDVFTHCMLKYYLLRWLCHDHHVTT